MINLFGAYLVPSSPFEYEIVPCYLTRVEGKLVWRENTSVHRNMRSLRRLFRCDGSYTTCMKLIEKANKKEGVIYLGIRWRCFYEYPFKESDLTSNFTRKDLIWRFFSKFCMWNWNFL